MTDQRWRNRVEALRRAGIEYLPRDRLEVAAVEVDAFGVAEPGAGGEVASGEEACANEGPARDAVAAARSARKARAGGDATSKHDALEQLRLEVASCYKCSVLCRSRTQTVFSDGSPNAELCFVGEAPGADEDLQGVPFVGKAGQLLTKIIEACKLKRDEVYICNVLKCRPPDNRNPMPDEVENCRPFLEQQLALVRPKMLVALGKYAAAYLLGQRPEDTPITRLRGQIREYCGIPVMITLHPAYLLRNPAAKRDVWEDMKAVMRHLGRPIE